MVSKLVLRGPVRTLGAMTTTQLHAFGQLLDAWRRRDDARRAHDLPRLSHARIELENARAQVRAGFIAPR